MNKDAIRTTQRQLYEILVTRGVVTAQIAGSQSISDSMDSIVPDMTRVCKNDVAVAAALSEQTNKTNLLVVEEGVPLSFAGRNDNWVLYSDTLHVVNPYDSTVLTRSVQWVRNEVGVDTFRIGIVSQSYLSQLRAIHALESDAGEELDEKQALQNVDNILRTAATEQASDIHFVPTQTDKVNLLFRIDGVLRVQSKIDLKVYEAIVRSVMENRCGVLLTTNTQQDGKFELQLSETKAINLRVSTMPVVRKSTSALKMVIRLLGNNDKLANIDMLGLSKANKATLTKLGDEPNGIIIITGPTGSGKTTTLSAQLLDMQSRHPNRNYHTIEDPVELQHQGMSHTEVTPTLSFAQALRGMLRQDPDVILVGEMRDNETAELGYKAAMTGHLVLTTLHTNNAHESIGRLERMNIDQQIIATNTSAILAQRLVRGLCPSCRVQYRLCDDDKQFQRYGAHKAFSTLGPESVVYKASPNGCAQCSKGFGPGLKGRRGVIEILSMTPEVQVAILEGVNPSILRRRQIQEGSFEDLWDDGLRLVSEGVVGFEELEEVLKDYEQDRKKVEESGARRGASIHALPKSTPKHQLDVEQL